MKSVCIFAAVSDKAEVEVSAHTRTRKPKFAFPPTDFYLYCKVQTSWLFVLSPKVRSGKSTARNYQQKRCRTGTGIEAAPINGTVEKHSFVHGLLFLLFFPLTSVLVTSLRFPFFFSFSVFSLSLVHE